MKNRFSLRLLIVTMIVVMAIPVYAYTYERNRTGTYYDDFGQYSVNLEGAVKEDTNKKVKFKVVPKKDFVLVKNIDYDASDFVNIIYVEISSSKTFGAKSSNNRSIIASGSVSGKYSYDSVKIDVGKDTTHKLKKGKKYYIRAYASQRLYTKDKKMWIEVPNVETMTVKTFKAK